MSGEVADDLVVSHECIECDNCGTKSPQKCCAQCSLNYYCSKECQVSHWKEHKHQCKGLKVIRERWNTMNSTALPNSKPSDTLDGPCVICLEDKVTNPVNLDCGHVFCFSCIGGYQQTVKESSDKKAACPYCRGDMPDLWGNSLERAVLYNYKAISSASGSDQRKKYCQLSLAEYNAAASLTESADTHPNALYIKARLLEAGDDPEATIKATEECLLANERFPNEIPGKEVKLTKLWQAEAYLAVGDWEKASHLYFHLIDELSSENGFFKIPMGICRAQYEMGTNYDNAIEAGYAAIEGCRHHPGVHKYLALSQKANGDIDGAKRTMSRAILYEIPWAIANTKQNKQILRELLNL